MTTLPPVAATASAGAVPPARTLLQWLYLGRITVVCGVFLAATLSWFSASYTALLVASLSVILALAVTAAAYWHTHIRVAEFGQTFLYGQALFDVALVTAIVHITGPYSYFAALYILVIAFNTVLMPLANGLLVALLAGFVYTADVVLGEKVEQPSAALLQVAVYWLVATATGYLASRVRVVRVAHQTLEAELRRVRLEAADILRHIGAGVLTSRRTAAWSTPIRRRRRCWASRQPSWRGARSWSRWIARRRCSARRSGARRAKAAAWCARSPR